MSPIELSVVVPTYKSSTFIGRTLDEIYLALDTMDVAYEVILIDDASPDETWETLKSETEIRTSLTAIRLARNAGQHAATLCGIRHARGSHVVTLDDDLQNDPRYIPVLYEALVSNKVDLVIARLIDPKKSRIRDYGSRVTDFVVTRLFSKPSSLKLSSYRAINADLVSRVSECATPDIYITGELLRYGRRALNVEVVHRARTDGKSTYTALKLIRLFKLLTVNYSAAPLKLVARVALLISTSAFLMTLIVIASAVFSNREVPGWASLAVLVSFFAGIILAVLAVQAEYLGQIFRRLHAEPQYIEDTVIKSERAD